MVDAVQFLQNLVQQSQQGQQGQQPTVPVRAGTQQQAPAPAVTVTQAAQLPVTQNSSANGAVSVSAQGGTEVVTTDKRKVEGMKSMVTAMQAAADTVNGQAGRTIAGGNQVISALNAVDATAKQQYDLQLQNNQVQSQLELADIDQAEKALEERDRLRKVITDRENSLIKEMQWKADSLRENEMNSRGLDANGKPLGFWHKVGLFMVMPGLQKVIDNKRASLNADDADLRAMQTTKATLNSNVASDIAIKGRKELKILKDSAGLRKLQADLTAKKTFDATMLDKYSKIFGVDKEVLSATVSNFSTQQGNLQTNLSAISTDLAQQEFKLREKAFGKELRNEEYWRARIKDYWISKGTPKSDDVINLAASEAVRNPQMFLMSQGEDAYPLTRFALQGVSEGEAANMQDLGQLYKQYDTNGASTDPYSQARWNELQMVTQSPAIAAKIRETAIAAGWDPSSPDSAVNVKLMKDATAKVLSVTKAEDIAGITAKNRGVTLSPLDIQDWYAKNPETGKLLYTLTSDVFKKGQDLSVASTTGNNTTLSQGITETLQQVNSAVQQKLITQQDAEQYVGTVLPQAIKQHFENSVKLANPALVQVGKIDPTKMDVRSNVTLGAGMFNDLRVDNFSVTDPLDMLNAFRALQVMTGAPTTSNPHATGLFQMGFADQPILNPEDQQTLDQWKFQHAHIPQIKQKGDK